MRERRAFLGVKSSIKKQYWCDRVANQPTALNNALAITQKYGVSDLLARILSGRNIDETAIKDFLDPTLRNMMPDPSCFTDMDKVANRIASACLNHESVAIFGDYDVDGACSSAILSRFLKHLGIKTQIYIPDRLREGYGPNPTAIQYLVDEGFDLIVTVDCGANHIQELKVASAAGVDVVVLDHHQVTIENLSKMDWLQVNPNRPDDLSGHGFLCAAAVVFMTLVAVSRILREKMDRALPDLFGFLDLVALATVCDLVPFCGLNRAFLVKGLQVARARQNIGLAALMDSAGIHEPLDFFHFGYSLGPRINAGGRVGNASLGARLLECDDVAEAAMIAQQLSDLNDQRKTIEARQLEEAELKVSDQCQAGEHPSIIIVADRQWHPGIVGLLAARLKERFNRPAIVMSIREDGMGTGSARSIAPIDIGFMIMQAVKEGIVEKGGGHAMAAGLTIHELQIPQLRAWFEKEISHRILKENKHDQENDSVFWIDAALSAEAITADLINNLKLAGPYGSGHEAPVFVLPAHKLVDVREIGKNHIRLSLVNGNKHYIQAIAFRARDTALGEFLFASKMHHIHLAGHLTLNHWNGRIIPQMQVLDAAPVKADPKT